MAQVLGIDGQAYCLRHLASYVEPYGVTVQGKRYELPIKIVFSTHCFSREWKAGHDEHHLRMAYGDPAEPRVFCKDRWDYSHNLPALVTGIIRGNAHCYPVQQGGYYKIDRSGGIQLTNPHAGWYLFFTFDGIAGAPGVRLDVRSTHYRESKPSNAKSGGTKKFRVAIQAFLDKRQHLVRGLPVLPHQ